MTNVKNLSLPQEGYARQQQFQHALGISKPSFYRAVEKGILPKPIKWGRASLWPVNQIREVLNNLPSILSQMTTQEQKDKPAKMPVQLEFPEEVYGGLD